MKILVIFTGGTIGSALENGYISPDRKKAYRLLEMYEALGKYQVEFNTIEPFMMLSENMTGESVAGLGKCLEEQAGRGYDGIIMTHGTDTIQYTAAALSYYLPELRIPVMLVSSRAVLGNAEANGLVNFAAALDFIALGAGQGVFVPYQNHDGVIYIHRGTRLLPHQPYTDDLYSVCSRYYGIMSKEGTFIAASDDETGQSGTEAAGKTGSMHREFRLELPDQWNSGILRIFPYPGLAYPDVIDPCFCGRFRAILLDTYHSGTLCGITPGMENFFRTAAEQNIPVFLTGADTGPDYASVKLWENLHITVLPTASPAALYMKLWMALSSPELRKRMTLEEIMRTPLGRDVIENKE